MTMSPAARSLQVFGFYLVGAGALLMTVPTLLLAPLPVPPPADGWVHVVGLVAAVLGAYYLVGARAELLSFMVASVWLRVAVALAFGVFVAAGVLPAALLLFGLVDLAGAAWTWRALRTMRVGEALRPA